MSGLYGSSPFDLFLACIFLLRLAMLMCMDTWDSARYGIQGVFSSFLMYRRKKEWVHLFQVPNFASVQTIFVSLGVNSSWLTELGEHRVNVVKSSLDLVAILGAGKYNLARNENEEHDFGGNHAVNEAREKFGFVCNANKTRISQLHAGQRAKTTIAYKRRRVRVRMQDLPSG